MTSRFSTAAADYLWGRQYGLHNTETVMEGFARVAGISRSQGEQARIQALMERGLFCPGGRVLAGIGTSHRNSLNCFVIGPDSGAYRTRADILDVSLKNALITKVGGGTGENLDSFPSKDARVAEATPFRTPEVYLHVAPSHPDAGMLREWKYRDISATKGTEFLSPKRRAVQIAPIGAHLNHFSEYTPVITVGDDMTSIITSAFEMMDLLDQARRVKGISHIIVDLSAIRPDGSPIKGSGGTASGPASFAIEIFDNFMHWYNLGGVAAGPVAYLRYIAAPIKRVTRQGGVRRGAGMATLSLDHPDFLDFVTCKSAAREELEGDISTFNISLLANASHIEPVIRGQTWTEAYGRMETVAKHAHATGEPGLLFEDTINRNNLLLKVDGPIKSTNPCGEIPLYPGEPCDLGAINLGEYVAHGEFEWARFKTDMEVAFEFLDANLDYSGHATEQTRRMSLRNRRLGLGIMGLADALIRLGLRYGSEGATAFTETLGAFMGHVALDWTEAAALRLGEPEWSVLAREAGAIERPRRNIAMLTVAPTGTTAMLFDASGGIEPNFSPFIWRKIGAEYHSFLYTPLMQELQERRFELPAEFRDELGALNVERVKDALQDGHGSLAGLAWVPLDMQSRYVFAHDVTPDEHVAMQAAMQRGFDLHPGMGNSISKTINLPNSASISDVLHAYARSYQLGCKGVTVYRDGCRSFQVLSTSSKTDEAQVENEAAYQAALDAQCVGGQCEKPAV